MLSILVFVFSVTNVFALQFSVCGIKYNTTSETTVEVACQDGLFKYYVSIPAKVVNAGVSYNVTSIGDTAFIHCKELDGMGIPPTILSIGSRAFQDCPVLKDVYFPASVTSIGELAFLYCYSLGYIDVEQTNQIYSSNDGVLFDKSQRTLIFFPPNHDGHTYSISDKVADIQDYAFVGSQFLTSLFIGSSVLHIGHFALGYLENLKYIYCWSDIPPITCNDTFEGTSKSIPINVVTSVMAAYKKAEGWKDFPNIVSSTSSN